MAQGFTEIDIAFATSHRVDDVVDYAKIAEEEGFDSFWLAELYYNRGLVATAAAVVANTKRMKLGLGIISPFSRHPGLVAMETATLDEISGGRLVLGLGIAQIATDRQGIENARPAVSLREGVEVLRQFFSGQTVIYDGQFFKMTPPGSALGFEPLRRDIPIYIGGMGPKSLELAGRIADGVILGMFSTPGFISWARQQIERGLTASGRTWNDFDLRSYITFSVDQDSRRAKDATRKILAAYLSEAVSTSASNVGSPRISYSGIDQDEFARVKAEVGRYSARGKMDEAEQSIPVEFIDQMIVAGTPEECRAKLAGYADAGLGAPALYQVIGPDTREGIRLAAREVLPYMRTPA